MSPRMERHHLMVLNFSPNQNFHSSRKTEFVSVGLSSSSPSSSPRFSALLALVALLILVTLLSFSFLK